MKTIQHAVIAAAGLGSRLNRGIPKCLVEVNGHKIMEYQLALLRDVPDVRIVTGYHGDEVIQTARTLRPDIKCIPNDRFATTTTLQSYYLGCRDIHDFFILLDGDVIPHKAGYRQFLSRFSGENLLGISPSNTQYAIYARTDGQGRIIGFTRTEPTAYEWSNIAVLHSDILTDEPLLVFQRLERLLPIRAEVVERLEIDTDSDMEYALNAMKQTDAYSL